MRRLVPAAAIAMLAIAPAASNGASPDPQAAVLAPVADGLVSSASPHKAFGSRTRLLVRGRPAARSLLAFDLGADRRPVAGAVLWVRVVGRSHGRLVVRRVSARGWSERRPTWRRRPALWPGRAARSRRLRRG